jgi:hypothetical protein
MSVQEGKGGFELVITTSLNVVQPIELSLKDELYQKLNKQTCFYVFP